ncbi:MAG: hypothetical protein ETSY1_09840 [Candidatus Entotheonella factor]|uniref:Uncharacterized protein n=1 Tax=Entotheonella factor TaxID=1429438 RepID=W4LSX3_ENTF1|nr:MAG: hypothetical protein ETSY1_09840 [Candidatus Entotheonella factor]
MSPLIQPAVFRLIRFITLGHGSVHELDFTVIKGIAAMPDAAAIPPDQR